MTKKAASQSAKAPNKSQILANIAETTGLSKKDVDAVMAALVGEVSKALGKKGPGVFQLPGLCKIIRKEKPATKKRQVRNPATGEMVWADPKPASKTVRIRPLKALKDVVAS